MNTRILIYTYMLFLMPECIAVVNAVVILISNFRFYSIIGNCIVYIVVWIFVG